jgi:hypothetical protein
MLNSRIKIVIGSPVDYEELVAYVVIDSQYIALLSMDKGKDALELVFFDEPKISKVDYDIFLMALAEAKRRLLK